LPVIERLRTTENRRENSFFPCIYALKSLFHFSSIYIHFEYIFVDNQQQTCIIIDSEGFDSRENGAKNLTPKPETKNLDFTKEKKMTNTTKTTNRNRNSNNSTAPKGAKRGQTTRYQSPQYFVIAPKTNSKVSIGDKEYEILMNWLELKGEEKAIEEQQKSLKSVVVDLIAEFGGGVKFRGFEFNNKTRSTYSYSAEVNDLEKTLEALKKKEREKGTAHVERETPYVEVRAIEK
jgi:hypothetical protein